jgi:hypothetical protein
VNLIFLLPTLGYGIYLYATTGSPILLILSGLTVTVWLLFSNQKRFDLDAEVSMREGRVWLGDKRLGVFPWLWSAPVRNVVYPALFPQPKTDIDFPSLPSWAWGMTVTGEVLASPICRTSPHSLVIGQTGAGKTQLLVRAIQAFQHEVIVLDLKGGDDYRRGGYRGGRGGRGTGNGRQAPQRRLRRRVEIKVSAMCNFFSLYVILIPPKAGEGSRRFFALRAQNDMCISKHAHGVRVYACVAK